MVTDIPTEIANESIRRLMDEYDGSAEDIDLSAWPSAQRLVEKTDDPERIAALCAAMRRIINSAPSN